MKSSATLCRSLDTEPLAALVARVDLFELVEHFAGPGKRSGRSVTFSCPNPAHPDTHPSFTVTTTRGGKQTARCFSLCAWHGDALDLVTWLTGLSTGDAATWLRRWIGEESRPAPKRKPAVPRPVTPLRVEPGESSTSAATFLSKYLDSRGWPVSVVERFSLSVVRDRFGDLRVRHPFFSPVSPEEWAVTYWQDRGPKWSRVKWLSCEGATPILYNLKSLESDTITAVVVCEGPADTITAALALDGLPVACVGVPGVGAWRTEWASLFTGLRVVVAVDSDTAGETLKEKVCRDVGPGAVPVELAANDLTDTAAEYGLVEVRELLSRAVTVAACTTAERKAIGLVLAAFPGSTFDKEQR